MDCISTITFEDYLKSLPLDRHDINIIKVIAESATAIDSHTVSFRTVLPSMLDTDLLISLMLHWLHISEHFMRELRVYALSANPKIEKHMQALLTGREGIYLTVLPVELREVFL